ncbi:MAG: TolC family protein [Gemmataceae bacterium]
MRYKSNAVRWLILITPFWIAGCVSSSRPASVVAHRLPVADGRGPATESGPGCRLGLPTVEVEKMTLAELLELASRQHPDLRIAQAQIEAARGKLIQAGLYPNPIFTWEGDEMNSPAGRTGTQGPIIQQEFVTAGKRRYAKAAAAQGWRWRTRQGADALVRGQRPVASGLFRCGWPREEMRVNEDIVKAAKETAATAEKLQKAGVANQPDVLQARVEWQQSEARLKAAQERNALALQQLATAAGAGTLHGEPQGTLLGPAPVYDWEAIRERMLTASSEIQERQAFIMQAERAVELAEAQRVPNVLAKVRPFYSHPDQSFEIKVELGAAIPVFNRNQGNIRTARADLDRAHGELRKTELTLTERLAAAFRRYQAALARRDALEKGTGTDGKGILADAAESLRLVRLGWDRGDPKYTYTAVLTAQRTDAETRLLYVQNLGELWRAASEIMTLIQVDPPPGVSCRD